jgi:hypothetical protein
MNTRTDYKSLNEYIAKGKTKQSRNIANNTIARIEDAKIIITLHSTDIAILTKDTIQLFTGGWCTLTTKDRLNSLIPSPFSIYQEKRVWYLWNYTTSEKWAFQDGITIHLSTNTITGEKSVKDISKQDKLKKQIDKFVLGYITALYNGKVAAPENGDCFYCHMRTENNENLGEAIKDTDHLKSHFTEKYYVPSMLYNAIEKYPISEMAKWVLTSLWWPDNINEPKDVIQSFGDIIKDQFTKSLKKYLYHLFEIP